MFLTLCPQSTLFNIIMEAWVMDTFNWIKGIIIYMPHGKGRYQSTNILPKSNENISGKIADTKTESIWHKMFQLHTNLYKLREWGHKTY